MIIESLRIENFRRFKLVDLEIPDGVTALVGRNGAGKSTLLEAIGWCLYGNEAARTEKDRWVLARDAASIHLADVYRAFVFDADAVGVPEKDLGLSLRDFLQREVKDEAPPPPP